MDVLNIMQAVDQVGVDRIGIADTVVSILSHSFTVVLLLTCLGMRVAKASIQVGEE